MKLTFSVAREDVFVEILANTPLFSRVIVFSNLFNPFSRFSASIAKLLQIPDLKLLMHNNRFTMGVQGAKRRGSGRREHRRTLLKKERHKLDV
jgi:hypothetical protein